MNVLKKLLAILFFAIACESYTKAMSENAANTNLSIENGKWEFSFPFYGNYTNQLRTRIVEGRARHIPSHSIPILDFLKKLEDAGISSGCISFVIRQALHWNDDSTKMTQKDFLEAAKFVADSNNNHYRAQLSTDQSLYIKSEVIPEIERLSAGLPLA